MGQSGSIRFLAKINGEIVVESKAAGFRVDRDSEEVGSRPGREGGREGGEVEGRR